MSKILDLKKFCDELGVVFPDIAIEQQVVNTWICSVKWYNETIISGTFNTPYGNSVMKKESALTSTLVELSKWLKSETNVLALINASRNHMS